MKKQEKVRKISIHALREEGDSILSKSMFLKSDFYPRPPRGGRPILAEFLWSTPRFLSTPSARRATHETLLQYEEFAQFLSTPSARRATPGILYIFSFDGISIHALREEGDWTSPHSSRMVLYFYPRPPRGGRPKYGTQLCVNGGFLSTPSARRATLSLKQFLSTPSARRATIQGC